MAYYTVRVEREVDPGCTALYYVTHPELPGCAAQGDTLGEAVASLAEARELYIASLVEDGLPVPPPQWEIPHYYYYIP